MLEISHVSECQKCASNHFDEINSNSLAPHSIITFVSDQKLKEI